MRLLYVQCNCIVVYIVGKIFPCHYEKGSSYPKEKSFLEDDVECCWGFGVNLKHSQILIVVKSTVLLS